jgi:2-polyprenyl-3-methyl-5-hydroxy-6-metoxy-1,4-benzoquinol methylase
VTTDCCPGCRGTSCSVVFRDASVRGFRLRRCRACRLVFAVPRPTAEELDAFYSAEYFSGSIRYGDYSALPDMNARRMWAVLPYLVGGHRSPGRLLDVGCATGGFLAEARNAGWTVRGTEVSGHAAAVAREQNGLDVDRSLLPQVDDTFDLITMWHVVEHLVDPLDALTGLRPHLAPNGRLFIELPNWNSAGRLARRAGWSQLTPPEHINFFTPHSLARMVRRAGYTVERAWSAYPWLAGHPGQPKGSGWRPASKALVGRCLSRGGFGGYVRLVAS